jgi:hypothetical protein
MIATPNGNDLKLQFTGESEQLKDLEDGHLYRIKRDDLAHTIVFEHFARPVVDAPPPPATPDVRPDPATISDAMAAKPARRPATRMKKDPW